ncbi:MAG: transaldolase [Bdellovibrionales bacterium]|nr:transaldolase [Bdellovibrionales bacterium]
MSTNPLSQLLPLGTSVWYDNIDRTLLKSGGLANLVKNFSVRGVTSNPSIFDKAIRGSSVYDSTIEKLNKQGLSLEQIFEAIAIEDIAEAADILRPVYDESGGDDGFVSIEVNPLLARKTDETINEAVRLYEKLDRPNIMIKIPGTPEGIPAVRTCLERGISINITLLFSVENYVEVANTYCEALRARVARGESVENIRSVASFFVSRVDSAVDKRLDEIAAEKGPKWEVASGMKGEFGIINSRLAYEQFEKIFNGDSFADLRAAGAAVQRPLWASTSTKNPEYRDVMYVEELIAPHTVNTMPHNTLDAFADHGKPKAMKLDFKADNAKRDTLLELGVDIEGILTQLQIDGVRAFSESFEALQAGIKSQIDN